MEAINLSYGQGRYYKTNNSLQLNYREGKFNYYLNYSMNANRGRMDMYALRTYYKDDRNTIDAMLEQPSIIEGQAYNHTLRTGVDYFAG